MELGICAGVRHRDRLEGRRSHPAYARTQEWRLPVVSAADVATKIGNTCQPSVLIGRDPSAPLDRRDLPLCPEMPSSFDFQDICFPSATDGAAPPDSFPGCFSSLRALNMGAAQARVHRPLSPTLTLSLRDSRGDDAHPDISSPSSPTSPCMSHG